MSELKTFYVVSIKARYDRWYISNGIVDEKPALLTSQLEDARRWGTIEEANAVANTLRKVTVCDDAKLIKVSSAEEYMTLRLCKVQPDGKSDE